MSALSRWLFVVTAACAALAPAAETPAPGRAGVFLSEARLNTLRLRIASKVQPTYEAWLKLKAAADKHLKAEPHAPKEWYVPGYYNDAEGHRKAKEGLQDDANTAYELALCYRMTGDEKYAAAAARLIRAWATTPEKLSRKDDSTLSFSYHFPALILAADLLRPSRSFPAAEQEEFKAFVREKALPLNTMGSSNNWGNWGLVLVLAGAAYLGDGALFEKGVARWKQFIEKQIAEDGRLHEEVNRNGGRSGVWYSHFSLMPQTLAAEIARVNGVDLYEYRAPNGRTMRQAFELLAGWTRSPAKFPYWKGDAKELHGSDYASYFEILNARWRNADAAAFLESRRPLTASHCAPYLTFTHGGLLNDDGK